MKKMNFDFCGKRKYFLIGSLAVILIGIFVNIFFGTEMDIQFTGGAIIKYSYQGDLDGAQAQQLLEETSGAKVEMQYNYNVYVPEQEGTANNLSVSISDNSALTMERQQEMLSALQEAFPDSQFEQLEANSVNPTMGREFFLKCLVAVVLASVLMLVYVAFRFKRIGGWSAGLLALLALLNDCLMVYFAFVIIRIPLDDNFVAVILAILGYSLNDTIVIYDRIRENRRLLGPKAELTQIVNLSINQSFRRTLNTSISTFLAVAAVTGVAIFYGLDSILSFSIPMMVGVVSGFYTSTFLTAPFWVILADHITKRKVEKRKKTKTKAKA